MRTNGAVLYFALVHLLVVSSLSLPPAAAQNCLGRVVKHVPRQQQHRSSCCKELARTAFAYLAAGEVGRCSRAASIMHKSPAMLRGVRLGAALWRGTYVSGVRALVPRRTVRVARLQGSRADGAARGGNSKHSSSAAAVAAKDGEATVTAPPAPRSRASRPSSSSSGAADGSTKKVKSKEDGGKGGAAMASLGTEYAESLTFLLSHTSAVKGVGPKRAQQMEKLGICSVADLLWHLPTGMIDRRQVSRVRDLVEGENATVLLKVVSVPPFPHNPVRISCVDVDGGALDLLFFGFGGSGWARLREFSVGDMKVVSGKVTADRYAGRLNMGSPDIVAPLADLKKVMVVQPTYPLTAGLSLLQLRAAVTLALESLESLPFPGEWIDGELMREKGWPGFREALIAAHNPQEEDELGITGASRARLAYDELLASQLVLALRRWKNRGTNRSPDALPAAAIATPDSDTSSGSGGGGGGEAGAVVRGGPKGKGIVDEGLRRLPFALTQNQKKALDEILRDMGQDGTDGLRMFRLLQGDVGSGKTAVAFLGMLKAIEQGSQSCLLAPTEVLAVQHLNTIRSMAAGIRRPDGRGALRVEVLTGSLKGKARQKLLEEVGNGEVDIVVATHAVLSTASTAFKDLGLAVVDEEQRFGVEQREKLTKFAQHVLYMSATPIPRSLTLALYGDMEVSQLREMPEGSGDIVTTLIPVDKVGSVVERLMSRQMTDDKINKSESTAREHLVSVNERYDFLVNKLGDRVSLLHGKMGAADKNRTLSDFSASVEDGGRSGLRVLVSTSIIEVGVDVPRAGVCVIENAEMFGLSQLHQMRGRLGRTNRGKNPEIAPEQENGTVIPVSEKKMTSHCILLYGPNLKHDATERLKAVRATRDGFLLAERDLALRGPGELLGVRQKGYMEGRFRVADLKLQGALAEHANDRARQLVDRWMAGPAKLASTGELKDSLEMDEADRPEGLSVLLALCGRAADARTLLGELVADSMASGRRVGTTGKSVGGDGFMDHAAAAAAATMAQEELNNVGTLSVPKRNEEPLEFSSSPQPPPPPSKASKSLRGGGATAQATAFAPTEPSARPTAHTTQVTIVVQSPPQSPPASDEGKQEAAHAPISHSLFSDEADFLERSASEQEAREDGGFGDYAGYLSGSGITGDEGYHSGFAPSFSPPMTTENKHDHQQQRHQQQEQEQRQQGNSDRERSWQGQQEEVGATHAAAASAVGPDTAWPAAPPVSRIAPLVLRAAPPPPQPPSSSGSAQHTASGWRETAFSGALPPPLPPRVEWEPARDKVVRLGDGIDGEGAQEVESDSGTTVSSTRTATPTPAAAAARSSIVRHANFAERDYTVVLFDVETTGLSPEHNRIIQLAAKVMGSDDPEHTFSSFVDPQGATLSSTIRDLTGITPEILAANDARSFKEVWPKFAQWVTEIGKQGTASSAVTGASAGAADDDTANDSSDCRDGGGVVLVAHNAKFDHSFLSAELTRGGFNRFSMGEVGIVSIVDSLVVLKDPGLWRQNAEDLNLPRKPERHGLGVLFQHLYGKKMPGSHTALGDVVGLEGVLSAPGISERWRSVASEHPFCQIPVPRSVAELQAALEIAAARKPPPRPRRRRRGW